MPTDIRWPIYIEGDYLIVYEDRGGTRGSNYFYLRAGDGLVHLGRMFSSELMYVSRRGRRKTYRYTIPLTDLCSYGEKDRVSLYEFSYTNKGYGPYATHYVIECTRKIINEIRVDVDHVPPIKPVGPELPWIFLYDKYVPKMVEEIKSVASRLDFKIHFLGKATRLEDTYRDPHLGVVAALTIPTWQGRQKSLEAVLRGVHELYVAVLIADALQAETLEGWHIEYASDNPTAIIKANGKMYTIWFQFSLIEWMIVALRGMFHSTFSRRRWYVRPDIVVFDRPYRSREELGSSPPRKILVIDAKIDVTKDDLRQLRGYRELFDRIKIADTTYIVASLERVAYRPYLGEMGYIVIEEVHPEGSGKDEFKRKIREMLDA